MSTAMPLDPDLARRYAAGQVSAAEAIGVERAMDRSPQWRALVGTHIDTTRLELVFTGITAELDAPKRSRIERLLARLGVPEHVARLMSATPVLRRSWYLASVLVLFFGMAAADPGRAEASLTLFLAVAPLVPVLGVALAYGPGVDPAHDMTVATPMSGFRLVLLRSVSVLASSALSGGVASLMLAAEQGLRVVAWILPSLALTAATLALATAVPTRLAAGITGGAWLLVVAVATRATSEYPLFDGPAQPVYAVLAVASAGVLLLRRQAFETIETRS